MEELTKNENWQGMITITKQEYMDLLYHKLLLGCLKVLGVASWEKYKEAEAMYEKVKPTK